jgi:phenylpropionate dioxygenase-like ring-hydroxylating dioxygenase large terminal subunit
MGKLFRRYWIPALLSEEIPAPDCAPVRVRLLGEDLIAFRDSEGKTALVGAHCPHRGAPMFFGRNEQGGLRCVYHGWKFDRSGACVHMPTEPPSSKGHTKVRIDAYPTWEGGGMVWTYMGPPEHQPAFPDHELVRTPPTHRNVSKTLQENNWLQSLEGAIDPTHASILHNMNIGDLSFLYDYDSLVADIELDKTDYGFTYVGKRSLPEKNWIRGYHLILPSFHMRGSVEGFFGGKADRRNDVGSIDGHIWIPIDDTNTFVYNFIYSHDPSVPLQRDVVHDLENRLGRGDHTLPSFATTQNQANDYLIDREVQRTKTFTGIAGINTQDVALQEGMGAIVDRTREHLGSSDRAILLLRQLFFEALEQMDRGEPTRAIDPASYRNVRAIDRMVPKDISWKEATREDYVAKY